MASSLSCFQLSKFGEHNIFVHGVHVLWNSRDLKLIMPKKTKKKYFCQISSICNSDIYLFKVNNINTRKKCEICSKLTIKTPERF